MTPAELLELSDERDQWERLCDDAYRQGYQCGGEDGYRKGYGQAVAAWKVTASNTGWSGPPLTHAEQDRRCYPPAGRLSWLLPRLGDVYEWWRQYCEHDDDAAEAAA